jgi:carbon starvation protein CstA
MLAIFKLGCRCKKALTLRARNAETLKISGITWTILNNTTVVCRASCCLLSLVARRTLSSFLGYLLSFGSRLWLISRDASTRGCARWIWVETFNGKDVRTKNSYVSFDNWSAADATVVLPVLILWHSLSSAMGNHPVIFCRRRCSFCSMYARLLEPSHRRRRHLTVHTFGGLFRSFCTNSSIT